MTRRTIPEQLAEARTQQLGDLEIRLREPSGAVTERSAWRVTKEQWLDLNRYLEKLTEETRK